MNLFKELVISAPVSARLQFGHNTNIILSAVDTSVRKVKGIPVKANTFITLSKVDPDTRKVLAQTEFNYWNLDSASEFCLSNFIEQMSSLAAIIDAVGKDMTAYDAALVAGLNGKELEEVVVTKDGAKLLQDILQNSFYDIVKDVIGVNCPLLKCKLVTNKKGFLELGKTQGWILPMDSELELPEVDAREQKVRNDALAASATAKIVKPDEVGAPKEDVKVDATTIKVAPEKPVKSTGFSGLQS